MAALASPSDLGVYMQITLADDDARADLILRTVSAAVLSEVGSAGADWTDEDVPDAVLGVVLAASARRWENTTGASEKRSGPFSSSWDTGTMLTDDERAILGRFREVGTGGLFTIRTTRDDGGPLDVPPTRFLEVEGGGYIAHVPEGNYSW